MCIYPCKTCPFGISGGFYFYHDIYIVESGEVMTEAEEQEVLGPMWMPEIVREDGRPIKLTEEQYAKLRTIMEYPGEVCDWCRDQLVLQHKIATKRLRISPLCWAS